MSIRLGGIIAGLAITLVLVLWSLVPGVYNFVFGPEPEKPASYAFYEHGEGPAGGFVLAGGEFFAELFAAAFVPEEIGEEGQDAHDETESALDDDILVTFPEEPKAVFGVRIHEILVDDDEITVVASRGLLVGTVVRHGGSTLGKGPFVSTPATGLSPPPGG